MTKKIRYKELSFTLIELIAVITIMGILAIIMMRVYQGKNEEAKRTAALHEMKTLAEALKSVESYYGYFVPLGVLNDLPSVPTGVTNPDVITDHENYLIVDPATGDNPPATSAIRTIKDMIESSGIGWKGPFVNFQRELDPDTHIKGTPLDPWGGEYHFLTVRGEVDYTGQVITSYTISTLDRFAIVSWGRDSVANTNDDLIYIFY